MSPTHAALDASPQQLRELADGNNRLALQLLKHLAPASAEHNLVFSPLSVTAALSLAGLGARGRTAAELSRVIGTSTAPQHLSSILGALLAQLEHAGRQSDGGTGVFDIMNGVFVDRSVSINAEYQREVQTGLGGNVSALDLAFNADASAKAINDWVSRATHGTIDSVVVPADLPVAGMLLVNTVVLSQRWEMGRPEPRPFHVSADEHVDVPTLSGVMSKRFRREKGFAVAELTFLTGQEALDVLLPSPDVYPTVASFIAALSPALLTSSLAQLRWTRLRFSMPRFESRQRLDLVASLQALGLIAPFRRDADFSGLSNEALFVGRVRHEARIKVDEMGVQAAASAADVEMTLGEARSRHPEEPIPFVADHPFVFVLRDLPTEAILFIGIVSDPRLKQ